MATLSCYEYGIYDNMTSIKARIACDNHGELYVNGTLAYSFDSGHGTGVTRQSIVIMLTLIHTWILLR